MLFNFSFKIFFGFIFFIGPIIALAQEETFPPPSKPIRISAKKALGKIIIDGKLDEKDWQEAPIISGFLQTEPIQGKKPKFKTEVRILFDSTNLYIGAFCEDSIKSKNEIRVPDLSRDFDLINSDVFGIRLDAFNGKRNCLGFDTNPYGVQRDVQVFDSQIFEPNWNALWKVKTQRKDNGWYAEFAIPFTTIRYPKPKKDELIIWNAIFLRIKRSLNEISTFPAIPRSVIFTRMTYGAEIHGIEPPNPKANIQVQPYALFENDKANISQLITHSNKPKIGLDVKWAVNTHAQLDFTINPDFAQADIDKPIINLGRSAISFPEKRQFFLDNSGLFSIGIPGTVFRNTFFQPFYSRTIGLNSEGLPQPIQGGARLVDRTPSRTIGLMVLRQEGIDSIIGVDYSILRFQKTIRKEDNIGLLFTNRNEEIKGPGILHSSNSSLSLNGLGHINNNLNLNYLASVTHESKDNTNGLAASANLNYQTNKWNILTEHHFVSSDYNPALGFLSRNGVLYNAFSTERRIRSSQFPKSIRQITPGLYLDVYQDSRSLAVQEADIAINPISIDWVTGANLFFVVIHSYQNLTDTFSPLHLKINPGKYNYWQGFLAYQSDQSNPFSISSGATFGQYFNGYQIEPNISLRYSPDPHFVFNINYDLGIFRDLGNQNQDLKTHLLVASTRIFYTPQVFFNELLEYNSLNNSLSYNTKVSWEYSPLSYIYMVLTNVNDKYNHYQERQIIAKISYVKQF